MASLLLAAATSLVAESPAVGAQRALQASMARGKQIYLEQCLSCHQVDGTGVVGMNPPLVKTIWVLGDKTALVRVVLNGVSGQMDVNGYVYDKVMAPQSDLSDQQIADVLTYVRKSFGNRASAVTLAQVKAIRAKDKSPGH